MNTRTRPARMLAVVAKKSSVTTLLPLLLSMSRSYWKMRPGPKAAAISEYALVEAAMKCDKREVINSITAARTCTARREGCGGRGLAVLDAKHGAWDGQPNNNHNNGHSIALHKQPKAVPRRRLEPRLSLDRHLHTSHVSVHQGTSKTPDVHDTGEWVQENPTCMTDEPTRPPAAAAPQSRHRWPPSCWPCSSRSSCQAPRTRLGQA